MLPGTLDWIGQNVVPGGLKTNYKFYKSRLSIGADVSESLVSAAVDAQTSGGLLMSVPAESAKDLLHDLRSNGIDSAQIVGEISSHSADPSLSLK